MTLSQYVKKRNGVSIGAPGSMINMLKRSLGASSFYLFWHYWNPIWGYYLSLKVMRPLNQFLPRSFAIVLTFTFSGAIHDLAISLIKWQVTYFMTVWFYIMGCIVLITIKFKISYQGLDGLIRAIINFALIAFSFVLSLVISKY